ncbi:MAG: ribosome-associated heat shock protein Hsp15 [Bacteroidia bacterium]|jgi:ribosome-associated heat shock protein Hsp15
MEKLRVDKWLWAIRTYKTRTAATKACEAGRVKRGDDKLKASSKININDVLKIRINQLTRTIKVLSFIEKRTSAPIAQTCYEDLTPPEDLIIPKLKSAFLLPNAHREKGLGRPTKKERRDIDKHADFDERFEDE